MKIFKKLIPLILIMIMLVPAAPSDARTFNVDVITDTADKKTGDGICADASNKCSLRAAIQEANLNAGKDTIIIKAATYSISIPETGDMGSATGDLDIMDNLDIQGIAASSSVLDGNQLHRVLHIQSGVAVSISNVTIRNGYMGNRDFLSYSSGGGIFVENNSSLSISDCIIENNESTNYYGGGIALYNKSSLTINNCLIQNNRSTYGGGISAMASANINIDRSIISNNVASSGGGGIHTSNASEARITNVQISDNQSESGGGLLSGPNSNTTLINTTINNNFARQYGGGIDIVSLLRGKVKILNTTISNNRAVINGGGIATNYAYQTMIIAGSTISYNRADTGSGGGIYNLTDINLADIRGSNISVHNSIIAANRDGRGALSVCAGAITSQGYNLFDNTTGCNIMTAVGDQAGTADNFVNPLLGPLTDNGGFTWTHALTSGSPAIDKGSPLPPGSGANACELMDQRGVLRARQGVCDMGAFEATGGGDIWLEIVNDSKIKASQKLIQEKFRIGNKGPNQVSNLVFSIELPVGSQNSTVAGNGWECITNSNFVSCERDILNINVESVLSMKTTPPPGNKEVIFLARISTDSVDPIIENNQLEQKIVINKAPEIITKSTIKYVVENGPVLIAPAAIITDEDDVMLQSASIKIIDSVQFNKKLYWNGNARIAVQWQAETATLKLTGEDTLTSYEQALHEISYENSALVPEEKSLKILITVSDEYEKSNAASVSIMLENNPEPANSSTQIDGFKENPFLIETDESITDSEKNNASEKQVSHEGKDIQKKYTLLIFIMKFLNFSNKPDVAVENVIKIQNIGDPWLTLSDFKPDKEGRGGEVIVVSTSAVFIIGVVNVYIQSGGFLGFLFSFPLWSHIDPVQILILSKKEHLRRKKEMRRQKKIEDQNKQISVILDNENST